MNNSKNALFPLLLILAACAPTPTGADEVRGNQPRRITELRNPCGAWGITAMAAGDGNLYVSCGGNDHLPIYVVRP